MCYKKNPVAFNFYTKKRSLNTRYQVQLLLYPGLYPLYLADNEEEKNLKKNKKSPNDRSLLNAWNMRLVGVSLQAGLFASSPRHSYFVAVGYSLLSLTLMVIACVYLIQRF